MSERYEILDGSVWSGDPNDPPVQARPACIYDHKEDLYIECDDESQLPQIAGALNAADEAERLRELLRRARVAFDALFPFDAPGELLADIDAELAL